MKFKVVLNGTDINPYHKLGLSQNPFPQIADYKYSGEMLHIQKLGGDPVPDTDYIRNHLKGFSPEFIEGCCSRFKKGEMVEFMVEVPDKVL